MIDDTKKEEITDVPETEAPATEAPAQIGLGVQDLVNIKHILDVATSRGVFKASEYQIVGATYDRLETFINSIAPPQEEVKPDSEEDTEDTQEA